MSYMAPSKDKQLFIHIFDNNPKEQLRQVKNKMD